MNDTIGLSPFGGESPFADAAVILQQRRAKRVQDNVKDEAGLVSAIASSWIENNGYLTPSSPSTHHVPFDVALPTSPSSTRSPFVAWSSSSDDDEEDSTSSDDGYSTPISSGSVYSSEEASDSSTSDCWRASPSPGPPRSRRSSINITSSPLSMPAAKSPTLPTRRPRPSLPHAHSIPTLFRSRTSRRRFSTIPRPLILKGLKFSEDSDEDYGLKSSPLVMRGVGHKSPAPKPESLLGFISPVSAAPQKRPVTTVLTEGVTTSTGKLVRPCILITPPTPTSALPSAKASAFSPRMYLHPTWERTPVVQSLGYNVFVDVQIDDDEPSQPIFENNLTYRHSDNNEPRVRGKQAPFPSRPVRRVSGLDALGKAIGVASPPLKSAWSDSTDNDNSNANSDSTRSSAFSEISLDSHSTSPDAASPSPIPLESSSSVQISPSSDMASPQIQRAQVVPRYAAVIFDLNTTNAPSIMDLCSIDIGSSSPIPSQGKDSAADAEFKRIEAQMEEADVGDYFRSNTNVVQLPFVPFSPPPHKVRSPQPFPASPRRTRMSPAPSRSHSPMIPASPRLSSAPPESRQTPALAQSRSNSPIVSSLTRVNSAASKSRENFGAEEEPWSEIALTPYDSSGSASSKNASPDAVPAYASPRVLRRYNSVKAASLALWDTADADFQNRPSV